METLFVTKVSILDFLVTHSQHAHPGMAHKNLFTNWLHDVIPPVSPPGACRSSKSAGWKAGKARRPGGMAHPPDYLRGAGGLRYLYRPKLGL
ncbi:MAG TPA: hypothetical protein VG870_11950 [Chitinophagaceae bacterium]|nr:hypothetical protein [Chitinophagaceae bacterium]